MAEGGASGRLHTPVVKVNKFRNCTPSTFFFYKENYQILIGHYAHLQNEPSVFLSFFGVFGLLGSRSVGCVDFRVVKLPGSALRKNKKRQKGKERGGKVQIYQKSNY